MGNPLKPESSIEIKQWRIMDENLVFEDGKYIPLTEINEVCREVATGIGVSARKLGYGSMACLIASIFFGYAIKLHSSFVDGMILLLVISVVVRFFTDDPIDLVVINGGSHGKFHYYLDHDPTSDDEFQSAYIQVNKLLTSIEQAKVERRYKDNLRKASA